MSRLAIALCVGLWLGVCPSLWGQKTTVSGRGSTAVVPPLVSFSGTLSDLNGKPLTGAVGVTFALYKDELGGAPLWLETQNVYPDKTGHYTVLLGATTSAGLPPDLFAAGEARWLGVQIQGQAEQARILLASAPYALKAADAQTVGGLPASAFVLAAPASAGNTANAGAAVQPQATGTTPVTTAGGTVNKLAKFDAAADVTNSLIFDNGTNVGIGNTAPATKLDVSGGATVRGLLTLPTTGVATATGGKNSQPVALTASAYNSGTAAAVNQSFRWQAEPAGNNTATPSGTLNLLFGSGTAAPAETGLKVSSKGLFTFAAGQTFPGTGTGNGTITGVTAGTDLTGGGTSGTVTLNLDTTKVPQLTANNTFVGTESITGSLGINTTKPTQTLDVSSGNAIVRGVGNFKATGNTAFFYVGDTSHSIEAIWGSGLAIGTYKAPTALFIADVTGGVGIGTTTTTGAMLTSAANSNSVTGLTAGGGGAAGGSGLRGSDAIHAFGGAGDTTSGAGIVATGGMGNSSSSENGYSGSGGAGGVFAGGMGGYEYGQGSTVTAPPGAGVVATGGGGVATLGGAGVEANGGGWSGNGIYAVGGVSAGDYVPGGAGVVAVGGSGYMGLTNGPGLVTSGGTDNIDGGGDGIDAIAGPAGANPAGLAGSFTGDVHISGNLTVGGTKSFQIDHPLDPANKYLYHAAVESSEVLNLYSGNATLDADGEATVQLPGWFEAINGDFRYQLTSIGRPSPGLYVAQEISGGRFQIAGGMPGTKVSWQVTGVRQDAWERQHPMTVEVEKPERERGYYINPELFGAPREKNMDWARNPHVMKQLKDSQEKQANQRRTMQVKPANGARP